MIQTHYILWSIKTSPVKLKESGDKSKQLLLESVQNVKIEFNLDSQGG